MKMNDIGNDVREVKEEHVVDFEGYGKVWFSLNVMGSHWTHLTRSDLS